MTDDEPPVTAELDVLVAWLRYSSSGSDAATADAIDALRAELQELRAERDALTAQLAAAFQEGVEAGMAIAEVEL
jgi:cell division protein FtsB